ncbi:universal stress protein [Dermacoccus abyssi]|uniref:Universal stress protein n=1 Tax=Dermacoccus abyssi TaxID=322596 RepID=A0A417Z1C2_9MICO|nr:universal stress protein [Dermacoccus abyssi]RHW44324.1 universal stress protein [Dermacoccus abyssi]
MATNDSAVPAGGSRYLVAWGGDKRSQDALKLGSVLARTFDATLDIVYVVHHPTHTATLAIGDTSFEKGVEKEARGWLKKAAKSVDKDLNVETHVAHDTSVTQGILRTAEQLGSAMIVIGAGSGPGQPVAANPIVGGLLHASPVPVAMAPRNYRKKKFDTLSSLSAAIGPRPGAQEIVLEAAEGVARVGLPLVLISLVSLKHAVKKMDWDERTALMVGSSRLARGRTTFLGTSATRMLAALPVPMIIVPRSDAR